MIPRKHPKQPIEYRTSGDWNKLDTAEDIWNLLDEMPWMEIRIRVPPKVWMKYRKVKK